jgi:hypothetical protein
VDLRIWRDRLVMLGVLVVVELCYVFIVSAGKMQHWPSYMAYYDLLADGFRAGHLHVSLEPSPELLAQADPFDSRNSRYWLGDASLYGGHYYFYWGPLPGVILAVAKILLRTKESIADDVLVFGFFSVAAVASTAFLSAVRRRLLPNIPLLFFASSVLALELGNPVPYLLASSWFTKPDQAGVADGDPMRIAAEVPEDLVGAADRHQPGDDDAQRGQREGRLRRKRASKTARTAGAGARRLRAIRGSRRGHHGIPGQESKIARQGDRRGV